MSKCNRICSFTKIRSQVLRYSYCGNRGKRGIAVSSVGRFLGIIHPSLISTNLCQVLTESEAWLNSLHQLLIWSGRKSVTLKHTGRQAFSKQSNHILVIPKYVNLSKKRNKKCSLFQSFLFMYIRKTKNVCVCVFYANPLKTVEKFLQTETNKFFYITSIK